MVLMILFFIYAFSSAAILPSCAVVVRTVNLCILLLVLIFMLVVTVTLTLLLSFKKNCLIIINTTLVVSLTSSAVL